MATTELAEGMKTPEGQTGFDFGSDEPKPVFRRRKIESFPFDMPQNIFLNLSPKAQAAYQAARDRDACENGDLDDWHFAFHWERAKMWDGLAKENE